MSFGGTVRRGRRGAGSSGSRVEHARRPTAAGTPAGRQVEPADDGEIDWERVALFGTGIALGAALGAGVALLFAPTSGEEIRAAIAQRGVRLAHQGRDVWDDLREELEWAARRGKRRVGRRVQRARWVAEDFLDGRRRPDRWRGKRRSKVDQVEAEEERETPELDEQAVQEIVEALC
ncbi:MAG: YtxH domain-containing protein [Gemmatimonadota bacterium]|nr:YtxH domain-containing protein [Gemmatimonadota bacterium]